MPGGSVQSVVPAGRWDIDVHYNPVGTSHKMYVRFGGWLEDIAAFDAEAFRLSGR
jgi:acyl transferase domain-containing protein